VRIDNNGGCTERKQGERDIDRGTEAYTGGIVVNYGAGSAFDADFHIFQDK